MMRSFHPDLNQSMMLPWGEWLLKQILAKQRDRASGKAVEDYRSPRRWRDSLRSLSFAENAYPM
jgi:hypothetical protein